MGKESLSEAQSKLLEMNKIIVKLDPEIRRAAFDILVPYYFEEIDVQKPKSSGEIPDGKGVNSSYEMDISDISGFIEKYETKTPKNNVLLLVAWWYSQYGVLSLNAKDIKELASSCGLVVPERPDNTMRTSKDNGKNLFSKQGKGWGLTVAGELYMQKAYLISKGKKTIPNK